MPEYDVRPATAADAAPLARLGSEAYGYPVPDGPPRPPRADGSRTYVATHAGEVVASVVDRRYESWFWGARLSTAGIASVQVAPEHRGRGLLTPLFEMMLQDAAADGCAISTLFPTAAGIYRRFGYETVGSYDELVAPTLDLAAVRTTGGSVRRAGVGDVPMVRDLYARWAQAHNGPLIREGRGFPASDEELAAAHPGVTLALDDDGAPSGYALWRRTGGYLDDGVLEIHDLLGLTEQAVRGLLHTLGTSAVVAPTTVLSTSEPDPVRLVMPQDRWTPRLRHAYGLAVLDVAGALMTRAYPSWLDLDLAFDVAGLPLAGQDGAYRLSIHDGRAHVERIASAETAFTARGLALRYAGTHSCTDLRRAGMLSGPETDDDRWDAVFSGRQVHIRDYF